MNSIIRLDNISFRYSDSTNNIINKINLEVTKGEFISVLGPNGSGKTTLVKLIKGLISPTEGKIHLNNIDNKQIGYVFQNPDNQIIGNTVQEDVAFALENINVKQDIIRIEVEKALEQVGLQYFKNYDPLFLSGGQKQKLAIAGILALKPEIIIFDESTSMLDKDAKDEIFKLIIDLNKNYGITIIQISHSIEEALLSDRIIIMNNGSIINDDSRKKTFSNRELLASIGLEVPFTAELSYRLKSKGYLKNTNIVNYEELIEEIWKLI